jgi:hypothetical protein
MSALLWANGRLVDKDSQISESVAADDREMNMRPESENPEFQRAAPPSSSASPVQRSLIYGGVFIVALGITAVWTGLVPLPRTDSGTGASVTSTNEWTDRDLFYGVSFNTLTLKLASERRISRDAGVIVNRVISNSPIDKAGVQVNDVIVAVDGVPVIISNQLSDRLRSATPGQQVSLTLDRGGVTRNHTVTAARCLARDPAETNRALSCKSWTN